MGGCADLSLLVAVAQSEYRIAFGPEILLRDSLYFLPVLIAPGSHPASLEIDTRVDSPPCPPSFFIHPVSCFLQYSVLMLLVFYCISHKCRCNDSNEKTIENEYTH